MTEPISDLEVISKLEKENKQLREAVKQAEQRVYAECLGIVRCYVTNWKIENAIQKAAERAKGRE